MVDEALSVPDETNLDKMASVVFSAWSMRKCYLVLLSGSFGWALAFPSPTLSVDASQRGEEFSNLSASRIDFAQDYPASPDLSCSLEEREDALSNFGCSCTTCISAVKQLRGQASLRQQVFGVGQNLHDPTHPHQVLGNTLGR